MEHGDYSFVLEEPGQQALRLRCVQPYPSGELRVLMQGTEVARHVLQRPVHPGQLVEIPIRRLPPAELPAALHVVSVLREPLAPPLPIPDMAAARRLLAPRLAPPPAVAQPGLAGWPGSLPAAPAAHGPQQPPSLVALERRVAALEAQLAAVMGLPALPPTPPAAAAPAEPLPGAPPEPAPGAVAEDAVAEATDGPPPEEAAPGDTARVPATSFHFRSGWYQPEQDHKGEFRWMGTRALITNPEPGRQVRGVEVELAHIYQQALQHMGASLDTRAARLVDVGGEVNLVLRFVPEEGTPLCDGLWLACSRASNPAADGTSMDDRTLSVAVLGVTFFYR